MEDAKLYIYFLERYAQGLHSESEHIQFLNWFDHLDPIEAETVMDQYAQISAKYESVQTLFPPQKSLINSIEQRLDQLSEPERSGKSETRFYLGFLRYAAAAILILAGTFAYFTIFRKKAPEVASVKMVTNDAFPGSNKAILTLADGSDIVLDDARNGEIAVQEGIRITKTADGKLIYSSEKITDDEASRKPGIFNTITTPKAGQFKVNLPDGTKVWLNSLSSIRFPASFDGPVRTVEITGEVYFEVAPLMNSIDGKTQKVPFHVSSADQVVEVLGTHFNINSYRDESATRTTLLEGSVRVLAAKKGQNVKSEVRLRPGEQALVPARIKSQQTPGAGITVRNVDSEEAVAWKEGYFRFKDAGIQDVMRQLARWYDIEVSYEGDFSSEQFTGFVSRNIRMSNVLKILQEGGGVKFSIKGKKVEVTRAE
ncbi:FecR family protein [Dyadobacter bucti]|uniref:FecR family protein n=1 Tax=Dyadobacter bucti TaxID=2572203 RepID=UPI0011090638|nr:FecR family protein [Dyadobacter bucti]